MTANVRRVCVLWAELRPYHLARLRALHERLGREGTELVALEVTGWAPDQPYAFSHEVLWPRADYGNLPAGPMAARVEAALDRHQPDAVAITSYSTPDARAALAWCRRHRRTAVMLFDSRRADAARSPWREAIKRTIVRQFDAALVAGTPQAAYAIELGIPGDAVFRPFDVVDNAAFARCATPATERRGFLSVARLATVKNLDGLLHAYARYRAEAASPWPLAIVGEGPERDALERQATEGVTFAGHVGAEALPAWYGQAGAFVLPSHKDTWGLVVNEAMAAGLPVLVSEGAGCSHDLVDLGRNGFRFAPDDPDELARQLGALAELDTDTRDAMGRASQEIIDRFTPDAFADGLWRAVRAGRARSDRPLGAAAAVALGALRVLSRRTRSFQSIPD